MNTALKPPAPEANVRLRIVNGLYVFDCWDRLAQSRPQFCPNEDGMSYNNPTGRRADEWTREQVATEILVHNPLAVFAGDARAAREGER